VLKKSSTIEMECGVSMKRVKLVCFSGTGGTKRFTSLLETCLIKNSCDVTVLYLETKSIEIAKREGTFYDNSYDLITILFPVHAFDAPEPVYKWIKALPNCKSVSVALISVSAGGEIWINQACRFGLIKVLSQKGYDVFYERMIIMPSNMLIATKETFSMRLLQLLPIKAENTAKEILELKQRRIKTKFKSRLLTRLAKIEKVTSKLFGKELRIKKSCTQCGLCVKSCPMGNIKMNHGTPHFGWHCVECLRCVYICPTHSIYPIISRYMVIKEGYDLERIGKQLENTVLESDEEITSGGYSFFKEYIKNDWV